MERAPGGKQDSYIIEMLSSLQNVPAQEYCEHSSQVDQNQDKKRSGSNVDQSPYNQPFNFRYFFKISNLILI